MKKTIIAIAVSVGIVGSTFAQGTVLFNNNNGTKVSTTDGITSTFAAGSFYYALFASTSQTMVNGSAAPVTGTNITSYAFDNAGWVFQSYGTNTATAGRFVSSSSDALSQTSLTFAGGGSGGYFTVVGWSANIGTTWQSVQAYLSSTPAFSAFVGESAVSGNIVAGINGSTPAAGLFGAAPLLGAFNLGLVVPVPEPGTLALMALGSASLLLFRRKK